MPRDWMIAPVMDALKESLEEVYGSELAFVMKLTGSLIPGLLLECQPRGYVRVVQGFPTMNAFPAPEPTAAAPVTVPVGFQIFMGVERCAYSIDRDGGVDIDEVNQFHDDVLADMLAMRKAIFGVFCSTPYDELRHSVTGWAPLEPDTTGGGEWQIVVQQTIV